MAVPTCYPASFENGMVTRFYVDANLSGASSWVSIGGETTSKMSVKPATADATNKDSAAGLAIAVGYDWSVTLDCQWNLTDPGQMLVRNMPLALEMRRVSWKPNGSSVGYYGYSTIGWDSDATNRAVTKLSLTVTGCGILQYA
jgi:hypothetical protein